MEDLKSFRMSKDDFFAHHPQSPLTTDQKRHFKGLQYFPENGELRLEVDIEELEDKEQILMQTSTGDVQRYIRFGRFGFRVNGQEAELTIFAGDHGYFLPFVDSLAGEETYGAGRYLEPERLSNGKFSVDFNLAYNPYCAYNERWSCPLPPAENRIQVPIRAGEMNYQES